MNTRSMLLAASILAVPAVAMAQPVNGLYIGGGLGINYLQRLKADATPSTASGHFNTRLGPAVVGSVGWGFGNGLRAELEGNFRDNNLHSNSPGGGGDFKSYGVMVNALYDFDLGANWIYPYLGVGVGYEVESLRGGNIGGLTMDNSTKGGLGVQGILGAAFPIDAAPGLSVTAEYRFMDILNSPTYGATPSGSSRNA